MYFLSLMSNLSDLLCPFPILFSLFIGTVIDETGNEVAKGQKMIFKHVYNHVLGVWEKVCRLHTKQLMSLFWMGSGSWLRRYFARSHLSQRVVKECLLGYTPKWNFYLMENEMRRNIWCICFKRHLNKPDSNPYADKSSLLPSCFLLLISHTHSSLARCQRLLSVSPHLA